MIDDLNWAIGGEAGHGIDSTGKIFAQALSRAGRHVFTSKVFASRIRGGYTSYKIRTAIPPVQSVVDRLDVLIALTERTVDENLNELHDGSIIIYDGERSMMSNFEPPSNMISLNVPLQRLAEETGSAIMRNIVALGSSCAATNFPLTNLDAALEKQFSRKGSSIVENNKKAALLGYNYVLEQYDNIIFQYTLECTDANYVLLNGDEAIGLGAIAAGCRFYAGYPITPATAVMNYLKGRIERFGGHVIQAEDELSAINLALGAARTGARSMTATSGPGLDLMTETFGLVSMSETPLVICNVMRAGPSTGMPTKQEQGDLNTMLYGGHGECERFILAPTTVAECFHKTVEAFNLADKYNLPVYLASDLSLAITDQTYSPEEFEIESINRERGLFITDSSDLEPWIDENGNFQPHAVTETGVSPRTLPGLDGGIHMVTGLEHDSLGRRTELPELREQQVLKRKRKLETATSEESLQYREFGSPDSNILVISWGSNEGAIIEAMDKLNHEIRFISVPYILPRPDLTPDIEKASIVFVIECNATGQFSALIEHDTLSRTNKILKYDGTQFSADEIAEKLNSSLKTEIKIKTEVTIT